MYKITLKNVSQLLTARDDVAWSQCRFLPRSGGRNEDLMNRNTSLSAVYWDEEPLKLSATAQTHIPEHTETELINIAKREDVSVNQEDQIKKTTNRDQDLKMIKARLRSKYQLYNELLPSNASGHPLEKAEEEQDLGQADFFGIFERETVQHGTKETVQTGGVQHVDASRYKHQTESLSKEEIYEKHWQPLEEIEVNPKEKIVQAPYGWIRMDGDNRQISANKRKHLKEQILRSKVHVEHNILNEDMLNTKRGINDDLGHHSFVAKNDRRDGKDTSKIDNRNTSSEDLSGTAFIDQQYFSYDGAHKTMDDTKKTSFVENNGDGIDNQDTDNRSTSSEDLSGTAFIDQQYFLYDGAHKTMDDTKKTSFVENNGDGIDNQDTDNRNTSSEDLSGTAFIDQQYFSYDGAHKTMDDTKKTSFVENNGESYIESQYFPEKTEQGSVPLTDIGEQYFSGPINSKYETEALYFTDHQATHLDRGYKYPANRKTEPSGKLSTRGSKKRVLKSDLKQKDILSYDTLDEGHNIINCPTSVDDGIRKKGVKLNEATKTEFRRETVAEHHGNEAHRSHDEVIVEQTRMTKLKPKANLENPETAYDLAMKIRQEQKGRLQTPQDRKIAHESLKNWKGKLDSKGFRILKDQVVNLEYLPREAVVDMLKNSIIFQNDDLIVIDKPYGLPSHGGPGVHHSVGGLLPLLAERFRDQKQPLHLIHRLDKETTGVMLLGRNAEVTWKIHGMFKRREVSKTYWALTKGVPNPRSGVVDIPMAEDNVKGRYRMGLRPHRDENTKLLQGKAKSINKLEAVTEFKVLSFISTAALVQCTPKTGVKHQIRCHLAFGLNTPIMGDHKYSHFSFLKPQKLHPETLNRLKIRQPTVRYLPMHLHARELVLPEFYEGKNTIFRSKLPEYFVRNMRWLKLAIPK